MKNMRKIVAILAAVLMLCTLIPFATVSAADDGINIVMEISDEVVNAGDEFTVTVILENNPGIIAASVQILFDTDAIEVAGEWDDGEFYPYIDLENPRKWGANNISYGPAGTCVVTFVNGLATKNITEEAFFTVTFVAKEDAYTGDYDLTLKYNPNNFFNMDFVNVPVSAEDGVITINGRDPEPEIPACEHEYFSDCDKVCIKCGEETRPEADHNVTHVAPVAATCLAKGNIEHWYCDVCGAAWLDEACTLNTNLRAVILPVADHAWANGVCTTCGIDSPSKVTLISQYKIGNYASQGDIITAGVVAEGEELTYTWYIKNAGQKNYHLSSVTGDTYFVNMDNNSHGRRIYCVITDKYGNQVQTETGILRRQASIVSQSDVASALKGKSARAKIKAVGDELTYTWYVKNAGSDEFVKSVITTNVYSVVMNEARDGREIYCVIKDKYGKKVTSDIITLEMN